jgi:hypothetical protein
MPSFSAIKKKKIQFSFESFITNNYNEASSNRKENLPIRIIEIEDMPFIPRVGEVVDIDGLLEQYLTEDQMEAFVDWQGYAGLLYVREIHHYLHPNEHIIELHLCFTDADNGYDKLNPPFRPTFDWRPENDEE